MPNTQKACDLLLTAQYVLTQDHMTPLAHNAGVVIKNGRILAVGQTDDLRRAYAPTRSIDLGNSLIMPGLINAHTHAPMTLLRGFADDLPLMTWLTEHIFPMEKRLDKNLVALGATLACAEMTRFGVTAFQDMYLLESAVFDAVDKTGLRMLGGDVVFAFPSLSYNNEEEAFDLIREQAVRWRGHTRIRVAVMPHAIYTTNPALLIRCRDLADELDLPLHLHLAETPSESAACLNDHGKRPLAYCRDLELLSARATVAHAVDLTEEELDSLAETGAVVVHCPRSNMKLASGIAPVPGMLDRGIAVGLGTDGAASSNNLNMFAEMSMAAMLHKVATGDPVTVPARKALDMATLGGAAALHWPELGALRAGGPADLVAVDLTTPNMMPEHTPASNLVYAATGLEVRLTMVEGEILYKDGVYSRIDMPALRQEVREAVQRLCSAK